MDNRPANTFLTKTEGNASRIFSLSAEDNEAHRSVRQTCTPIKIKEEDTSDEIQEYAATTMSELLGWYGYDKVDSGCTRSLNLDHFTSTPSSKSSKGHQMNHKFSSNRETSKSPVSINMNSSAFEFPGLALPHSINNLTTKRQFTSSPLSLKKVPLDSTSTFAFTSFGGSACLDNVMSCSWCGRITQRCESGRSNTFPYNMINTLGHFCSEACFAAGRRAVFKQAKMCDWCRHLRNPISYADFQDGESQLQFCSDKCLNQYKMNIFCHETQTHLMLHGLNNISFHDTEKSSLITPELWFRNSQSPLHSPTEGTFLVDEHLISDLSASSNDKKEMEKEQMEIEKSIESNRKVTRKKDSFCIQKCIKTNNCNEKKNLSTVINEGGINEENKFCHFMSNQSHCRISCSEKSAINYKDFKKTCNLLDVTNYNSYNCQRNSVILSENNIHVKDIKNLQEDKEEVLSKETLKSTSCFATSTTSTTPYKISLPSKPFTDESNDTEYEKQANVTLRASPRLSSMQSNQIKSSVHSLPTTLLPPVTVLVPHPIPIPIPIPIPVPVPTSFLRKLMNDGQKVPLGDKDSKYIDSIENKCFVLGESKVTTNTNVATQTTEHIPTAKFYSSSTSDSKEDNDNLHSLEHNTKPPRKRKRSNESINYKHEELPLKRMNKFIVA